MYNFDISATNHPAILSHSLAHSWLAGNHPAILSNSLAHSWLAGPISLVLQEFPDAS
jgi:hypothetical protein